MNVICNAHGLLLLLLSMRILWKKSPLFVQAWRRELRPQTQWWHALLGRVRHLSVPEREDREGGLEERGKQIGGKKEELAAEMRLRSTFDETTSRQLTITRKGFLAFYLNISPQLSLTTSTRFQSSPLYLRVLHVNLVFCFRDWRKKLSFTSAVKSRDSALGNGVKWTHGDSWAPG